LFELEVFSHTNHLVCRRFVLAIETPLTLR